MIKNQAKWMKKRQILEHKIGLIKSILESNKVLLKNTEEKINILEAEKKNYSKLTEKYGKELAVLEQQLKDVEKELTE